jgi:predicted CXXCH cytochrome family protein
MRKYYLLLFVFIGILFVVSTRHTPDSHAQQPQENFVGAETCSGCHEDLYKGWKSTRHAKAFETLKKKSQETLPACQKCHVTGFEKTGGYVDQELTPDLAGVQCESCHGPAASHAANPENKKGLVAKPAESLCRECHTKGQDPKFDYQSKIRLVHGISQKGGK